MTDEEYVAKSGLLCPFCQSHSAIAWGDPDFDGTEARLDIQCIKCGEDWQDIYQLTGYVHTPDDEPAEA